MEAIKLVETLTEEELYKKSPQELTSLLYQALITNLELAIDLINQADYAQANKQLQKANDIIYRLGAGINYEAGIIADQLEASYNYIADRLIEANLTKDIEVVKEVLSLIKIISDAWNNAVTLNESSNRVNTKINNSAKAYDNDFSKQSSVDIKE